MNQQLPPNTGPEQGGTQPPSPEYRPPNTQDVDPTVTIDQDGESAIQINPIHAMYLGVRSAISMRRMERAGERMAKFDHKMALYSGLDNRENSDGEVHPTPTGEPAQPQSRIEWNMAIRSAERKRVKKVYGGESTRPPTRGAAERERQEELRYSGALNERMSQLRPDLDRDPNDSPVAASRKAARRKNYIDQLRRADTRLKREGEESIVDAPLPEKNRSKNLEQKIHTPLGREYSHLARLAEARRNRQIGKIQKHWRKSEKFKSKINDSSS